MSEEKCFYDYANKCDCSEDDKCGCTFPNNMPHNFDCSEEKMTNPFDQLAQSAAILRDEETNTELFNPSVAGNQPHTSSTEAGK